MHLRRKLYHYRNHDRAPKLNNFGALWMFVPDIAFFKPGHIKKISILKSKSLSLVIPVPH